MVKENSKQKIKIANHIGNNEKISGVCGLHN